jgi:hypothetical protein
MALNPDGTASCANCGAGLPGYGVIFGAIVMRTNRETGALENYIFCYENGCADLILSDRVNH